MRAFLLFLVLSYSAVAVCLKINVAVTFSCNPIDDFNSNKWCEDKFGVEFGAYETTSICSLDIQEKYRHLNIRLSKLNFKSEWDVDYTKRNRFECSGYFSNICQRICDGKKSCVLEEDICKDCVGTSIEVVNLYKNVGKTIVSTETAKFEDFIDLVYSKNYVTFASNSVYNIIGEYDSKGIKKQFQSLCSDGTEYPLIFAKVYNKTRDLINFSYVVCNTDILKLSTLSH